MAFNSWASRFVVTGRWLLLGFPFWFCTTRNETAPMDAWCFLIASRDIACEYATCELATVWRSYKKPHLRMWKLGSLRHWRGYASSSSTKSPLSHLRREPPTEEHDVPRKKMTRVRRQVQLAKLPSFFFSNNNVHYRCIQLDDKDLNSSDLLLLIDSWHPRYGFLH